MREEGSYCSNFWYEILVFAALVLQISFSVVILVQIPSQVPTSGSTVHYLPGFQGPLPFHLETGYVGVGESEEEGQVFYYFIESQNNPEADPLMLWLSGGPGCSSFSGLFFEIGPIAFKRENYNGSLPNLVLRPWTWTKACSIIFADLPMGTGFSYANTSSRKRSDREFVRHAHQFLRKWLLENPRFLSNQVYIGGDSYVGIPVPPLVQEISNGNEKGIQPWINIQGYLLGNPFATREEKNYLVPLAHGMALISHELFTSLQKNCKGDYINMDGRNQLCVRDLTTFHELLSGLDYFSTLDPQCEMDSPRPYEVFSRRSSIKKLETYLAPHLAMPPLICRSFVYFLGIYWANDEKVREALHVRKESKKDWVRCDSFDYEYDIDSSFPYHVNLSAKGYRSLIYSGDHDPMIPFLATQAWIRDLNYSIIDDWRSWLVNGQLAGYTRSYSNQMTFATVKGAGHVAPEDKAEECSAMFHRWLSKQPL